MHSVFKFFFFHKYYISCYDGEFLLNKSKDGENIIGNCVNNCGIGYLEDN